MNLIHDDSKIDSGTVNSDNFRPSSKVLVIQVECLLSVVLRKKKFLRPESK